MQDDFATRSHFEQHSTAVGTATHGGAVDVALRIERQASRGEFASRWIAPVKLEDGTVVPGDRVHDASVVALVCFEQTGARRDGSGPRQTQGISVHSAVEAVPQGF